MAQAIASTPSWRSMCAMFAKQARDRFDWDRRIGQWRVLSDDGTHWREGSFEDDILPVWLTAFSAQASQYMMTLPDGAAKKRLGDMLDGTKWSSAGVAKMLSDYCRAMWSQREVPEQPRHLLNLRDGVLDVPARRMLGRDAGHLWQYVVPHGIYDLEEGLGGEHHDMWMHFVECLDPDSVAGLRDALAGTLTGVFHGRVIHIGGRNMSWNRMMIHSLWTALGDLAVAIDDRHTGQAHLPDDVQWRTRQPHVRFLLVRDGFGRLNQMLSGYDAMTDHGRVAIVHAGMVPPHLPGHVSYLETRMCEEFADTAPRQVVDQVASRALRDELNAAILAWIIGGSLIRDACAAEEGVYEGPVEEPHQPQEPGPQDHQPAPGKLSENELAAMGVGRPAPPPPTRGDADKAREELTAAVREHVKPVPPTGPMEQQSLL